MLVLLHNFCSKWMDLQYISRLSLVSHLEIAAIENRNSGKGLWTYFQFCFTIYILRFVMYNLFFIWFMLSFLCVFVLGILLYFMRLSVTIDFPQTIQIKQALFHVIIMLQSSHEKLFITVQVWSFGNLILLNKSDEWKLWKNYLMISYMYTDFSLGEGGNATHRWPHVLCQKVCDCYFLYRIKWNDLPIVRGRPLIRDGMHTSMAI